MDFELFDQLSWTRCYELYANVVTVNHGEYGGSIAWTPKSGFDKEIFRTHGKSMSLAVTVSLPLKDLIKAQREQFSLSVQKQINVWKQKTNHEQQKAILEIVDGMREPAADRYTCKR